MMEFLVAGNLLLTVSDKFLSNFLYSAVTHCSIYTLCMYSQLPSQPLLLFFWCLSISSNKPVGFTSMSYRYTHAHTNGKNISKQSGCCYWYTEEQVGVKCNILRAMFEQSSVACQNRDNTCYTTKSKKHIMHSSQNPFYNNAYHKDLDPCCLHNNLGTRFTLNI